MRTRLIEIAGGLLLGLDLMGASLGATVIMGRAVKTRVDAGAPAEVHVEVAR